MHIQRLLTGLTLAALLASACSSSELSQDPAGWQLVGQRPNGIWPALRVTSVSETVVSVVLVVSGGCPDGGPATPSFTGFAVDGDIIQAVVSRLPLPVGHCIVHGGTEFDVMLDLRTVPASARTMILGGQACPVGDDICIAVSSSMPADGPASPSG